MVTHVVKGTLEENAPWIRIFPVRTPTLPPATHTNAVVVGRSSLVVIDPASPYDEERAALDAALDALGLPVDEIWLTHHHVDHASGAAHLARRLGIGIAAHRETAARVRCDVSHVLDDDERLEAGGVPMRALFTPGHAPGHLCFLDEESRAIVAGDMVASTGTIIVEPSDGGDMAVYLESLRKLRALDGSWLIPSHGPPIADVAAKLDFYVAHRLEREARVQAALAREPRTVEELVPPAYPDVPPAVWPLAARSLLAHLLKLEREGRAARIGDRWVSLP